MIRCCSFSAPNWSGLNRRVSPKGALVAGMVLDGISIRSIRSVHTAGLDLEIDQVHLGILCICTKWPLVQGCARLKSGVVCEVSNPD